MHADRRDHFQRPRRMRFSRNVFVRNMRQWQRWTYGR